MKYNAHWKSDDEVSQLPMEAAYMEVMIIIKLSFNVIVRITGNQYNAK